MRAGEDERGSSERRRSCCGECVRRVWGQRQRCVRGAPLSSLPLSLLSSLPPRLPLSSLPLLWGGRQANDKRRRQRAGRGGRTAGRARASERARRHRGEAQRGGRGHPPVVADVWPPGGPTRPRRTAHTTALSSPVLLSCPPLRLRLSSRQSAHRGHDDDGAHTPPVSVSDRSVAMAVEYVVPGECLVAVWRDDGGSARVDGWWRGGACANAGRGEREGRGVQQASWDGGGGVVLLPSRLLVALLAPSRRVLSSSSPSAVCVCVWAALSTTADGETTMHTGMTSLL